MFCEREYICTNDLQHNSIVMLLQTVRLKTVNRVSHETNHRCTNKHGTFITS